MSKFKVGDTVRVSVDYCHVEKGSIHTIAEIDSDGDVWTRETDNCLNIRWIELVSGAGFKVHINTDDLTEGFDPVQKPNHYNTHPSGVECRTITRHESSNIGQAIQYIWRKDLKGTPIQDMQKAIECLQDEIKLYVENIKKDEYESANKHQDEIKKELEMRESNDK